MAAVTQTGTPNFNNPGSLKQITFPDIDIAANGDTLATGLQRILNAFTNVPGSVTSMTFSGGTITFVTGGAVNNVIVTVFGY